MDADEGGRCLHVDDRFILDRIDAHHNRRGTELPPTREALVA